MICVVAESHLNIEVERLTLRTDYATGGVLLLASDQVQTGVVKDPPKMPNNACSTSLFPNGEGSYCIQVTGVYLLPPSQNWSGGRGGFGSSFHGPV